MSTFGILAGSFKPFHKGHLNLIQQAAANNKHAVIFVSLADRKRNNEVSIAGQDMSTIWNEHLMDIMPDNATVSFLEGESPVRRIYSILGDAEKAMDGERYTIYSDPNDIMKNFDEDKIKLHFPNLVGNNKLEFVPIDRDGEFNISGTEMRTFLQDGDKANFINNLPDGIDKEEVWKILRKNVESQILSSMY